MHYFPAPCAPSWHLCLFIYLFFIILFGECWCSGFFCVRLLTLVLNNSHLHSESGPIIHSYSSSPLDGSYLLAVAHTWTHTHAQRGTVTCAHANTPTANHDVHPVTLSVGAMKSANWLPSLITSVKIKPDSQKGSTFDILLWRERHSTDQLRKSMLTLFRGVFFLRSGCISTAPPEFGEDQRHPGAEQSPDAGGADGLWRRGCHRPPGTTAPLAQPPGS